MRNTVQNEVRERDINSDKPRIFARVISKQLTDEDLKRVSEGLYLVAHIQTIHPSMFLVNNLKSS